MTESKMVAVHGTVISIARASAVPPVEHREALRNLTGAVVDAWHNGLDTPAPDPTDIARALLLARELGGAGDLRAFFGPVSEGYSQSDLDLYVQEIAESGQLTRAPDKS